MPDPIMPPGERLVNKLEICLELLRTALEDLRELKETKAVCKDKNEPGE